MAGVDFRRLRPRQVLAKTGALGGGGALRRTARAWGLGKFGRVSLPVEAALGHKTVTGAYFRGRGACTQYDPKIILCAKTLEPNRVLWLLRVIIRKP